MVRTEISLFLKNAPGELGKLATLFSEAGINIDALTENGALCAPQRAHARPPRFGAKRRITPWIADTSAFV